MLKIQPIDRPLFLALMLLVGSLFLTFLLPSPIPREPVTQAEHGELPHSYCNNKSSDKSNVLTAHQLANGEPARCCCCCQGSNEGQHPFRWGWDWWLDSPITVFTGLLVVVGFFQAIFLWLAFNESRKASNAANRSAHALMAAERAYVYVKDFEPLPLTDAAGRVVAFQCLVYWVNSGTTPTRELSTWVNWVRRSTPLPAEFEFPDIPDESAEISGSFLGPKAEMNTLTFSLSVEQIVELRNEQTNMYIWGHADYRDVFPDTPIHRTEFCNRVVGLPVPGNPNAAVIAFRHYKTHNSAT